MVGGCGLDLSGLGGLSWAGVFGYFAVHVIGLVGGWGESVEVMEEGLGLGGPVVVGADPGVGSAGEGGGLGGVGPEVGDLVEPLVGGFGEEPWLRWGDRRSLTAGYWSVGGWGEFSDGVGRGDDGEAEGGGFEELVFDAKAEAEGHDGEGVLVEECGEVGDVASDGDAGLVGEALEGVGEVGADEGEFGVGVLFDELRPDAFEEEAGGVGVGLEGEVAPEGEGVVGRPSR